MKNENASPFLKWAGGKRQLLNKIKENIPQELKDGKIKTYIEPFLGGGAVFFELNKIYDFDRIILNDNNADLIMSYISVKENIDDILEYLYNLEKTFIDKSKDERSEMFYNIRNEFNEKKKSIKYDNMGKEIIENSAYLMFLNKTCFNGLYRVNSKGEFNVPFGKYKNPKICDEKNLRDVHFALQGVTLIHEDFENLIEYIDNNTFAYMDPPYRPLSGTSSFNRYQKSDFNDESQKRLANWYSILNERKKSKLLLSNSDPKNTNSSDNFFDELYKDFQIIRLKAKRSINSKGNKRGKINELLIKNYS